MKDQNITYRKNGRILLQPILEKCRASPYTSIQLSRRRVLKLHSKVIDAGGSVQLASIKNWRHFHSFHLFLGNF